jgi:hypothetical protein
VAVAAQEALAGHPVQGKARHHLGITSQKPASACFILNNTVGLTGKDNRVKQLSGYAGQPNQIIQPEFPEFPVEGDLHSRKRLGGLLRYYYREAA